MRAGLSNDGSFGAEYAPKQILALEQQDSNSTESNRNRNIQKNYGKTPADEKTLRMLQQYCHMAQCEQRVGDFCDSALRVNSST